MNNRTSIGGPGAPIPLYRQVKQWILNRINCGEWPVDSRIPSENELVSQLGVSRMTVHRSVRELALEGRLVRVPGTGTFVADSRPQAPLMQLKSLSEEAAETGATHFCIVHQHRREKAKTNVVRSLDLAAGGDVFHTVIVHHLNGLPVQLEDRYVNPQIVPDYINEDFTKMSPSLFLRRTVPYTEAEHIIEAMLPDKRTRSKLDISPTEPVLVLRRKTWLHRNVITSVTFTHPSTRYRLGGRFGPSPCAPSR